jgi:hypothetical protein
MRIFLFVVLLFSVMLMSCHSKQQAFRKQLPESLCNDLHAIRALVENSSSVAHEFNFSSPDSIVIYSETCIHAGFQPFLHFRKVEDMVAQNKGMSREEAYIQLEKTNLELIKIQVELPAGCIKNNANYDSSDLLVRYWYNPADSNYSVEIEKILHQPGFSSGFVIEYTRTDSGFVQTHTSVWVE